MKQESGNPDNVREAQDTKPVFMLRELKLARNSLETAVFLLQRQAKLLLISLTPGLHQAMISGPESRVGIVTAGTKAPSSCNKSECIQELQSFGQEVDAKLTVQELRALVKKNRVQQGLMKETNMEQDDLMTQILKGSRRHLQAGLPSVNGTWRPSATPTPMATSTRKRTDGGEVWTPPGNDVRPDLEPGSAVCGVGRARSKLTNWCQLASCPACCVGGPDGNVAMPLRPRHAGQQAEGAGAAAHMLGSDSGSGRRALQEGDGGEQGTRPEVELRKPRPVSHASVLQDVKKEATQENLALRDAMKAENEDLKTSPTGRTCSSLRAHPEVSQRAIELKTCEGSHQDPARNFEASPATLTAGQCSFLDACLIDFEHSIYQACRDPNKMFLMELACSPTSVLTAEATKRGLRADRMSIWNGHDLTCNEGIKKTLEVLKRERPDHLWISTECGAFSPMQNINRRTQEGLLVAWYAFSLGCQVHWEWSRKCRAWKWPLMDEWRKVCGTQTAILSGCQVNLRGEKSGKLLGKEWRVESTSSTFSKAIHCPCQGPACKKSHGQAEGQDLKQTAFCTPELARRVLHHMIRDVQQLPERGTVEERQREILELQGINMRHCMCRHWKLEQEDLVCPHCLKLRTLQCQG